MIDEGGTGQTDRRSISNGDDDVQPNIVQHIVVEVTVWIGFWAHEPRPLCNATQTMTLNSLGNELGENVTGMGVRSGHI